MLTELEVGEKFDKFIEKTDLFIVEKEVRGEYLFGRNLDGATGCRIDRILIPTEAAADNGLTVGPIGIELKSEKKEKFGPTICQCLDYRTALFTVFRGTQNVKIMLDTIALYPAPSRLSWEETGSILTQNRIWRIKLSDTMMAMSNGSVRHLGLFTDGTFEYKASSEKWGRKNGSR